MARLAIVPAGVDVRGLAGGFTRHLKAANRSPKTIEVYLAGASGFADFLLEHGIPRDAAAIRREHVEHYVASVAERASAASVRFRALQQFWKWAVDAGEVAESPMARMVALIVPATPPPVLTDAQLAAILKSMAGRSIEERRETARQQRTSARGRPRGGWDSAIACR
jgi:site-specific recombinase XerD